MGANVGARKAFSQKLKEAGRELKEKEKHSGGVIGVVSDGEDESDGEE